MDKLSSAKKNSFSFSNKHSLEEAILKRRKLSEASNSSNSSDLNYSFSNILNFSVQNTTRDISSSQSHSIYNGNINPSKNYPTQSNIHNSIYSNLESLLFSPDISSQNSSLLQLPSILKLASPFLSCIQQPLNLTLNRDTTSRDKITNQKQNNLQNLQENSLKNLKKQQYAIIPQLDDNGQIHSSDSQNIQNQKIRNQLSEVGLYELFQNQDLHYYFPFGLPIGNLGDMIKGKESNNQYNKFILNAINRKIAYDQGLPDKKVEIVESTPESKLQILEDDEIINHKKQLRKMKVELYLEKKKLRQSKKSIVRYVIRKDLADNRKRIQGRFVKHGGSRFKIDLNDKNQIEKVNEMIFLKQKSKIGKGSSSDDGAASSSTSKTKVK